MKELWKKWCEQGIRWPYLHDPVSGKPSITIMFPYITFAIAVISIVLLHIWPSMIVATATSIVMWAVATVFYMLRKLNKAKFDLENRSFELDSGEPTQESEDDIGN